MTRNYHALSYLCFGLSITGSLISTGCICATSSVGGALSLTATADVSSWTVVFQQVGDIPEGTELTLSLSAPTGSEFTAISPDGTQTTHQDSIRFFSLRDRLDECEGVCEYEISVSLPNDSAEGVLTLSDDTTCGNTYLQIEAMPL